MSESLFPFVDAEAELRREWWLNHGCPFPALYGDDGELQCTACFTDFKRTPLPELKHHVFVQRVLAHGQQAPRVSE